MQHLEQDYDDAFVSYNQLIYVALAFLLSCVASFSGHDGVKKHFDFFHGNIEIDFRFNCK